MRDESEEQILLLLSAGSFHVGHCYISAPAEAVSPLQSFHSLWAPTVKGIVFYLLFKVKESTLALEISVL